MVPVEVYPVVYAQRLVLPLCGRGGTKPRSEWNNRAPSLRLDIMSVIDCSGGCRSRVLTHEMKDIEIWPQILMWFCKMYDIFGELQQNAYMHGQQMTGQGESVIILRGITFSSRILGSTAICGSNLCTSGSCVVLESARCPVEPCERVPSRARDPTAPLPSGLVH